MVCFIGNQFRLTNVGTVRNNGLVAAYVAIHIARNEDKFWRRVAISCAPSKDPDKMICGKKCFSSKRD